MKKLALLLFAPIMTLASCGVAISYNEKGYVALEDTSLSLDGITNVDVKWINGSVNVSQGTDSSFSLKETETEYPLYYKIETNIVDKKEEKTIYIKVAQSGISNAIINKLNKDLEITLPSSLDSLYLDSVNCSVSLKGDINVKNGKFNAVNGIINADHYQAENTRFETVNASISINHLDYKTVTTDATICSDDSGSNVCKVEKIEGKNYVNFDVINASITMNIDEEDGYLIGTNSINGSFTSEFGTEGHYGPAKITINVDVVNGNVKIGKVK